MESINVTVFVCFVIGYIFLLLFYFYNFFYLKKISTIIQKGFYIYFWYDRLDSDIFYHCDIIYTKSFFVVSAVYETERGILKVFSCTIFCSESWFCLCRACFVWRLTAFWVALLTGILWEVFLGVDQGLMG